MKIKIKKLLMFNIFSELLKFWSLIGVIVSMIFSDIPNLAIFSISLILIIVMKEVRNGA